MIGAFRTTNLDGQGVPTYTVGTAGTNPRSGAVWRCIRGQGACISSHLRFSRRDVQCVEPAHGRGAGFGQRQFNIPHPSRSFVFEDAAVA